MNVKARAVVVIISLVKGMVYSFKNGFNYLQDAVVAGNYKIL